MTEKENHLFIEIKGLIDFDKITTFITRLLSNEKHISMHNIWHFEETTVGISFGEFWNLIDFISNTHPKVSSDDTKIAIVTSTATEHALATIWVGYAKTLPFESANFNCIDKAQSWINN